MKIAKAPELLKKAAAMCKSKTGVITARLLVLASPRRRMATAGAISHRIHALMVSDWEKETLRSDKTTHHLELRKVDQSKTPAIHGGETVDFSHQLALFDQGDGHGDCPDWTLHPIFSDDGDSSCSYTEEDYEVDGDDEDDRGVVLDALDEPSVMDVIRSNREVEGVEFNMEDEIDQAADMFIRRFRERMNQSF